MSTPSIAGLATALVMVTLVFFAWRWSDDGTEISTSMLPSSAFSDSIPLTPASAKKITTTDGVERWYTNDALKFSFRLPDGFYAPDINTKVNGVYGVKVYNDASAVLIVLVYPLASGTALTEERVKANLPDVSVIDVKEGFIATVARGLWFRTNAPEWGGDGIAFWVPYNGHLYQIMSARKDQDLMDFVVASWQFAPPRPTKQN